jgi:hypothetical protein
MPSSRVSCRSSSFGSLLALAVLTAGCTEGVDPSIAHLDLPDPAAGEVAFRQECAGCHASADGFDLARFTFTDTTILRRATAHVDTATAHDIIAHIRSLGVAPVDRDVRIFQPHGAQVADDVEFAMGLFGADAWPAGWGEDELLAVDPKSVAVAVPFPVWSDEESNLDWMPDVPLPPTLLDARGAMVRGALGGYAAAPTEENLDRALAALRTVSHDRLSPTAPCARSETGALAEPVVCFQVSRWTAALAAQHLLRYGLSFDGALGGGTRAQDAFWEVGQATRRGLLINEQPVENAEQNWVSWMMLGWVFAPGNHASGYTASGLRVARLPRHAAFVAVRSLVARDAGSHQPYQDLRITAIHAPMHWLEDAVTSALRALESREARGEGPTREAAVTEAALALTRTVERLERRLGTEGAAALVARVEALHAWGR